MMKKVFVFSFLLMMAGIVNLSAQGIFGTNYNSILRKGLLDYKKGNYDEALLKYNQVYNFKKNDPVTNYNLGTILYKKGNYDTASYFFDNAIKYVDDPNLKSKAYYNMGNSYMHQKKYDKAIESYVNSLKYNPNDPDTRYNLSYALKNKQQQKQQQQQQQQQKQPEDKKNDQQQQPKMDQNKAHELINSLNNKEQEQNKKMKTPGGNTKSKDW